MPVMLFKLRGVDDDEAEEIRMLLSEAELDYYETTNGRWGLGFAAIWLNDETTFDHAKSLIDKYQHQRYVRAREEFEQLRLEGKAPTTWQTFKERPIQVLVIWAAVLFVCLLFLSPFMFF